MRPSDDPSRPDRPPFPEGLYAFLEGTSPRFPEEVLRIELDSEDVIPVMRRALGDLTPNCPGCGGLCDEHRIRLRDASLRRLEQLCQKQQEICLLYRAARQYGFAEPEEILEEVYERWFEMVVLFAVSEPEDEDGEDMGETEAEGEEDDA